MASCLVLLCLLQASLLAMSTATATVTGAADVTTEYFLTPTGRRVSRAAIETHVTRFGSSNIAHRLFEVTFNLTLFGLGHHINLALHAPHEQRIFPPPDQEHIIDGVRQEGPSPVTIFREGAHYTLIGDESGRVHFVSAPGLHLVAVDHEQHPGILINTFSTREATRMADFFTPPRASVSNESLFPAARQVVDTGLDMPTTAVHSYGGIDCFHWMADREIEIAVASDFSFCRNMGWNAAVVTSKLNFLMKKAGERYSKETCLAFKIVSVEVNCGWYTNDPYRDNQDKNQNPLTVMSNVWLNNNRERDGMPDLVAFLSMPRSDNDPLGYGDLAATCQLDAGRGFSWTGGADDDAVMYTTIAHEIGHNFGLHHDVTGIMSSDSEDDTQFSLPSAESLLRYARTPLTACITRKNGQAAEKPRLCSTSARPVDCFGWRELGRMEAVFDFEDREITREPSVKFEVFYQLIHVRIGAPWSVDNHPRHGDLSYVIPEASVTVEYENAGGQYVTSFTVQPQREFTLVVSEPSLNMLKGRNYCCNSKLYINVQGYMAGKKKDGTVLYGSQAPFSKTFPASMPCLWCSGGFDDMTERRKCPACK